MSEKIHAAFKRRQQQHEQQQSQVHKDDMLYCHGTARRVVARAALHLGIDSMTAESIDVLSSCLLDYMQQIGAMMANNAEASGRSSAYCNIYDAINAIELCSRPAAATTKTTSTLNGASHVDTIDTGISKQYTDTFGKVNHSNGASWKDLAVFCFGPNWYKNSSKGGRLLDPDNQGGNDGITTSSRGGKTGPSTLYMINGSSSTSSLARSTGETGWNAPYPEEVPHFPVVVEKGEVANPHPFPEPRLHRHDVTVVDTSLNEASAIGIDTDELDDSANIPESVFQKPIGWGDLSESKKTSNMATKNKRILEQSNDDESKPPAAKRVKLMESTNTTTPISQEDDSLVSDPLFLPTFFPPLPVPKSDDKRIVVTEGKRSIESKTLHSQSTKPTSTQPTSSLKIEDDSKAEWDDNNPTRLLVRSALVGRTAGSKRASSTMYWGSSWSMSNRSIDLTVPAGRPQALGGMNASGTDGSNTGGASAISAPSIVPISRASGSRVSRILEGSMDPPVL